MPRQERSNPGPSGNAPAPAVPTAIAGNQRARHWPDLVRRWCYPVLLALVYLAWFGYMMLGGRWALFRQLWPISLAMAAGSFVAGSTPGGGAAFAFPVLTKLLDVPTADARNFGLMIQAVGMCMAGVLILARRVPIAPRVIGWVSLGGVFGQILGTFVLIMPGPYPKILFTFIATTFGVALFIARWGLNWPTSRIMPPWSHRTRLVFVIVGLGGGVFAAATGAGIDMLTFVVLTLAFGLDEKIGTPTSVIIMGLNSVVGFFLHGVIVRDLGVAWNYWLVAVPIVVLGAPLGAWVASRVRREHIIIFLLSLIVAELATTLWLVPFTPVSSLVTGVAMLLCGLGFYAMLRYRRGQPGSRPAPAD